MAKKVDVAIQVSRQPAASGSVIYIAVVEKKAPLETTEVEKMGGKMSVFAQEDS